jgi:hypothetical protein
VPQNIKLSLATNELGRTGLEEFGGFIYEEFLPQLQGTKGIKIYREMSDNDPVIGAILFAIEMLIRQVDWRVEPAGTSKEEVDMADFLESNMSDMSDTWQDTISEVLSMLTFGWSFHEIVYKRRQGMQSNPDSSSKFNDGKIGWAKLPIRSQESLWAWIFSDNGDLLAMEQQPPPDYRIRSIPMEKALLFRTKVRKGNPEGRSILRNAYRPWYFKKNIETIEGIGLERDLAGLPIAWVPPELLDPNASTEDRAVLSEIKKIVRNVRRDEQEGIVYPLAYDENNNKLYDLTLLSTGGRRQFDTGAIVQRYDSRIAMTVLADFILLGHENVGSFALSSDKTNLFSVALGAWMDSICQVFNRKAVPQLFALNGYSTENLPKIVHGDIESIPLSDLGEYINKLSGAGYPLFPNKELEDELLRVAGLPINSGGEEA